MKILFIFILISAACMNEVNSYPHHLTLTDDLSNSVDEFYNLYLELPESVKASDNNQDIISLIQQHYPKKLKRLPDDEEELRNIERAAYLLVKSKKQRDKRYVSYLTLCHFKICNMGRKRTTRYFHMIKTLDDNNDNLYNGHD